MKTKNEAANYARTQEIRAWLQMVSDVENGITAAQRIALERARNRRRHANR